MIRIGTHNSATCLPSSGLLSILVSPFACCQSKSIAEQFSAGCRYFDLRLRMVDGRWRFAHGLWESSACVEDVLGELNNLSKNFIGKTFVMVTYEGSLSEHEGDSFLSSMINLFASYPSLTLTEVNVKKPKWRCLCRANKAPNYRQAYMVLDGRSWHTYLPIPWLWKKIYYPRPDLADGIYSFVDFL